MLTQYGNPTGQPEARRGRTPPMSSLLLPPPPSLLPHPQPSSRPDLSDGVFDDFPVDRKSCQLLGPTALVHDFSFPFSRLTQRCF